MSNNNAAAALLKLTALALDEEATEEKKVDCCKQAMKLLWLPPHGIWAKTADELYNLLDEQALAYYKEMEDAYSPMAGFGEGFNFGRQATTPEGVDIEELCTMCYCDKQVVAGVALIKRMFDLDSHDLIFNPEFFKSPVDQKIKYCYKWRNRVRVFTVER